jgi:uncharacterized protein (PEP-CTERM system associated)
MSDANRRLRRWRRSVFGLAMALVAARAPGQGVFPGGGNGAQGVPQGGQPVENVQQLQPGPPQAGFVPSFQGSEIYVDNVDLAPPGSAKTDAFITELQPGFRWLEARELLQVSLNYTLQYLHFSRADLSNQTFHQLFGFANASLVPDWFFVRVDANAAQVTGNPAAPSELDTLFNGNGNLLNAYTGSVSPYLKHQFGDTVAEVEYTLGAVRYRGPTEAGTGPTGLPISGTRNQRLYGSWGTDERAPPWFTWNASFDREVADYEGAAPTFRYEEALLKLGIGLTQHLRLIAEGGAESDLAKSTAGGLDTAYEMGGLSYTFGPESDVQALAGHRFYGHSYDFRLRWTGRVVSIQSTYTEGPTTEAEELLIRPLAGTAQPQPVIQQPLVGDDLAALVNDVFVRKYFDSRLQIRGRRTALELNVNIFRRYYLTDTALNDHTIEVGAGILRDMNPRNHLRLTGGYVRYGYQAGVDRHTYYRLEWQHDISRSLSLSASAGRYEANGFALYNVNYALVGVNKKF